MRKSYAILIVLSVIFILPLLITMTNSLMSEAEIGLNYTTKLSIFDAVGGITQKFVEFVLIPGSVPLSQYAAVLFEQPAFIVLLMNSVMTIGIGEKFHLGYLQIIYHQTPEPDKKSNMFFFKLVIV